MTDTERQLIAFAEGGLEPREFEQALSNDAALERYLREAPAPHYAGGRRGDLYVFLLQLDYADPANQLDAWGAITWLLKENNISFTPTLRYEEGYQLLLSVQPAWLDIPTDYFVRSLLPAAGDRSGHDLAEWLRVEIHRRFRYVSEPPEWIQGPAWPISQDEPLVFLGQFTVEDYFHDQARVFVFHCPRSGESTTVIQVA